MFVQRCSGMPCQFKAKLKIHTPLSRQKSSYVRDCKLGQNYMTDTLGEITVLDRVEDPETGDVHFIVETKVAPFANFEQTEYEYAILYIIPKDVTIGEELDATRGYYTMKRHLSKYNKKELVAWAENLSYASAEFLRQTSQSILEWVESESAKEHED